MTWEHGSAPRSDFINAYEKIFQTVCSFAIREEHLPAGRPLRRRNSIDNSATGPGPAPRRRRASHPGADQRLPRIGIAGLQFQAGEGFADAGGVDGEERGRIQFHSDRPARSAAGQPLLSIWRSDLPAAHQQRRRLGQLFHGGRASRSRPCRRRPRRWLRRTWPPRCPATVRCRSFAPGRWKTGGWS